MNQLVWLDESCQFPETSAALDEPNGLLAAGGDLSVERLLEAYSRGIFPWYSEGQPIFWWSPSPRMVLHPEALHIGRSNKRLLNKNPFTVHVDCAFDRVMAQCAEINRTGQDGTWITRAMMAAYSELHRLGHAHSVEAWCDGKLVGGLYGLALGKAFFGESMFSSTPGASKVAFIFLAKALQKWEYRLIDCQIHTGYLESFGAKEIPRRAFETLLADAVNGKAVRNWQANWPFAGAPI